MLLLPLSGSTQEDAVGHVEISEEAIESLARWYAREAGVRNLASLVDKVRRVIHQRYCRVYSDEGP